MKSIKIRDETWVVLESADDLARWEHRACFYEDPQTFPVFATCLVASIGTENTERAIFLTPSDVESLRAKTR